MCMIKEAMDILEEIGLPPESVSALRKLWNSTTGMVFVESSSSKYVIRPKLANKMEKCGLIKIFHKGSSALASFDDKGSDLAFDLFGAE